MLDKTLATLAGVAVEIYPDLNVFEVARPYALRHGRAALPARPHRRARSARDLGRYTEAFLEYPFQISELLEEFKDGELEITVRPEGFTDAVEKLQARGQPPRARPCVAAALLMSSAIISVFAHYGRPGRALAARDARAWIVSFALVAWLCVGIFRSGRW